MNNVDTHENYQNDLLKVLIRYAEYLGPDGTFYQIQDKGQVITRITKKNGKWTNNVFTFIIFINDVLLNILLDYCIDQSVLTKAYPSSSNACLGERILDFHNSVRLVAEVLSSLHLL